MEVLYNPVVGYLELLASFAATFFALRSTRFWVCFPLGLLGVVLLFDAAWRIELPLAIFLALGAGLLVIGLLGRKRAVGPPLALFGTQLLLIVPFAMQLWAVMLAAGLALLLIASIVQRIPWAPLLAALGWVAACLMTAPNLLETLSGTDIMIVVAFGTGLLVALITLIWLAPNRAWSRIALYAILLVVGLATLGAYPVYEFFGGVGGIGLLAATALAGGIPMALLRDRLFGEHLVQHADATSARRAPTPPRQPAAQPRPVAPPPHAPADIFISYKREERARVEAIAKALRDLKLSIWFDARLQTGNSFDDEINREVRAAKCVLVCWSPGAVASEWVRAEASIGRQRGVLAACFLAECEPYPPFNLVHAEDLSTGALDGENPAWAKMVEQIGHLVGRPGLGAYVSAQNQRGALGAWLADHASDPLADVALAQLRRN